MQDARTVLPALLAELDDTQLQLSLRFVLYLMGRGNPSGVDEILRALATFDLSHLAHLAFLLDDDNLAELVFRAEDLLRAQNEMRVIYGPDS